MKSKRDISGLVLMSLGFAGLIYTMIQMLNGGDRSDTVAGIIIVSMLLFITGSVSARNLYH